MVYDPHLSFDLSLFFMTKPEGHLYIILNVTAGIYLKQRNSKRRIFNLTYLMMHQTKPILIKSVLHPPLPLRIGSNKMSILSDEICLIKLSC